jgi:hypothetical protein
VPGAEHCLSRTHLPRTHLRIPRIGVRAGTGRGRLTGCGCVAPDFKISKLGSRFLPDPSLASYDLSTVDGVEWPTAARVGRLEKSSGNPCSRAADYELDSVASASCSVATKRLRPAFLIPGGSHELPSLPDPSRRKCRARRCQIQRQDVPVRPSGSPYEPGRRKQSQKANDGCPTVAQPSCDGCLR